MSASCFLCQEVPFCLVHWPVANKSNLVTSKGNIHTLNYFVKSKCLTPYSHIVNISGEMVGVAKALLAEIKCSYGSAGCCFNFKRKLVVGVDVHHAISVVVNNSPVVPVAIVLRILRFVRNFININKN